MSVLLLAEIPRAPLAPTTQLIVRPTSGEFMSLAALALPSVTRCHLAGTMITSRGKFAESSHLEIDKSHTPSLDSQGTYEQPICDQ